MNRLAVVVYAACIIFFIAFVGVKWCAGRFRENQNYLFVMQLVILSVSLYLNLWISVSSGFGDTASFVDMMEKLATDGFFGLYSGGGIQYPPFFQFLFWAMAHGMKAMGIPFRTDLRLYIFCVKLPGIVCEFLTAGLLYKMAKKYASEEQGVIALFLCLLNPGVLLTTAYVCQVDMLYVFWMVLTVYLLIEGRLKTAYFAFAAAVLFKFQAVFITPVIFYAVINHVFLNDFSWKRFFEHLTAGLLAIGMIVGSYVPFVYDFKTGETINGGFISNFSNTTAGFGAATQNACNFWMLLGYNEVSQTELFGFLSCQTWGKLFIVTLVLLSFCLFCRYKKDVTAYPMLAALLVYGTWCFAVRMMERYMYAAIFLAYLGYVCRPGKKRLGCAVLVSAAYILQVGYSYVAYPWVSYHEGLVAPRVLAFFMVICFGCFVYAVWSEKTDAGIGMASEREEICGLKQENKNEH